jgi:hypothetical protein
VKSIYLELRWPYVKAEFNKNPRLSEPFGFNGESAQAAMDAVSVEGRFISRNLGDVPYYYNIRSLNRI